MMPTPALQPPANAPCSKAWVEAARFQLAHLPRCGRSTARSSSISRPSSHIPTAANYYANQERETIPRNSAPKWGTLCCAAAATPFSNKSMAKASLCLPSHERKSTSPYSGRPEKRQPPSSLDQPVASVSGRGNSDRACRFGHEIHRRRNEAPFLERKLRRHALWRFPVCHDRRFLYAHADASSGTRLRCLGQGRHHPLQEARPRTRPRGIPFDRRTGRRCPPQGEDAREVMSL